ncbi:MULTISPECIES: DUF3237 domain-containing protein [Arthrobacter]|uniref:DUF3237 domain-containing protein n=1 Tax=Arthrobacter TaxID=1663 RepID=UPI0006DB14B2|nr:DUF3237 domain-containing protein [Arthrobacter sp. Edens01]KPN21599.1 hypothetical protein AO716_00775 [Arthrobacter sp. Edens01]
MNPTPPTLTFLASISVQVGQPIEVGQTPGGLRRIIPILGGRVEGPELRGRVLPAGADFQLLRSATLTELEAKYAVETDSGERLYVNNFGLRSGSEEDIAALMRGEQVDPARIYFRCTPRIEAPDGGAWAWLSSRILVGTGVRLPDEVRLDISTVD